jgi:endonuclease/exonuclease/phosphatase family metal-dependent hydrolase
MCFLLIWGPGKNLVPSYYNSEIRTKKNPYLTLPKSRLKVITWNMGYAQGIGSEGTENYRVKSKEEFVESLNGIIKILNQSDADICLMQEVDLDSGRSQHINQINTIFEKTHFNYVSIAPNWLANYVPFPYWPLSHHFGKVHSAGVIFSRYPIVKSYYHTLEKPKSNPWWYNLFYLYRYFQIAELIIGNKQFSILNLHLEAFDLANREFQAKKVSHYLETHSHEPWMLIGGDFNSVPSYAEKKDILGGFYRDRRHDDETLNYFANLKFLKNALSEKNYKENEKSFFTFPSDQADRMLDHFFVNQRYQVKELRVIHEALELSDHLPLEMEIEIQS